MAIADGYAQASRSPGVVNVHICCGLGNAMGMLYNTWREGTPLVLTAGQQDRRLMFEEPILWGQMVETVRPWTKWAAEVQRVEDLPSAVRRAVQTAMTPPTGPVFLSLPLDVQTAPADGLDLTPPRVPDTRVRPPREPLVRAAERLAAAERPAILVGSRVQEADAVAELVRVAEWLGAPVIHEATTSHGRCSFPPNHPLYAEPLPFWSPDVRRRLAPFDVLLVVGMKLMQQYIYHEPSRPIPEHLRIVQIDDAAWELGKNYPVEMGILGHPKLALDELATHLAETMTAGQQRAARRRAERIQAEHEAQRNALRNEARSQEALRPLSPLCAMDSLARVLPPNVAVVEESPTTTMGSYFERIGALQNTEGYFAQRGWALGWGLNCAIGVQLAWPDRPVLAVVGDGSAMYGIQGLWTAARYGLPVTFVITNNREYRILKDCAQVLGLPASLENRFEGLDLDGPEIDYVTLARSLGVRAERVDTAGALSEAVAESLAGDEPRVVEVLVRRPEV
ncbi:MAG: thiamine pyrophosphate-dependent enzyme, partial [Thermoguttaceae bacterium]